MTVEHLGCGVWTILNFRFPYNCLWSWQKWYMCCTIAVYTFSNSLAENLQMLVQGCSYCRAHVWFMMVTVVVTAGKWMSLKKLCLVGAKISDPEFSIDPF